MTKDFNPRADANIFYHLENWKSNPSEPSTTLYLGEIQTFQRHLTTVAFKLAGGVDLPSASNPHKPLKQHIISQEFLSNITKAFLETIYAFLDGLVHLASEESPVSRGHQAAVIDMGIAPGSNPLELLDLTEIVSLLGTRANLCSCLYRKTEFFWSFQISITCQPSWSR